MHQDSPLESSENLTELYSAILALKNPGEIELFLRDVLTDTELKEISERWHVARLLAAGFSYTQVISETGLSSATVARVASWLKNGSGGYRLALERVGKLRALRSSLREKTLEQKGIEIYVE